MADKTKKSFLDQDGLNALWAKMCSVFPNKTGNGVSGTWNINVNGSAGKLKEGKDIGVSGAVTSTATEFDGSKDISIPITSVYESYLAWGNKGISGGIGPLGASLSSEHSANRIAYLNPNAINVEYSEDAGSTWTSYSISNDAKVNFVTTSNSIYIGKSASATVTTNQRMRITLTGQDGTNGYVYTKPKKLLLNVSNNGHTIKVNIFTRKGSDINDESKWTAAGEYALSGWSGWNDIPLILNTFGGGKTQTANIWQIRFVFSTTAVGSSDSYKSKPPYIIGARLFGDTCWIKTSNMGETGHLYSYDAKQNATFPGTITATKFIGTFEGNSSNSSTSDFAKAVEILESNDDANYNITVTKNSDPRENTLKYSSKLFANPKTGAISVGSVTSSGNASITGTLTTNGAATFKGAMSLAGNLTLMQSNQHNTDQYIYFKYSTTDLDNYSWRLGYLGSGSGDGNVFTIQSNAGGAWSPVVNMSLETRVANFANVPTVSGKAVAMIDHLGNSFTGATANADGTNGHVPAPTKGNQSKFLRADGTWATPTNTKNSTGTTEKTATKLFLAGATTQGSNPTTYSNKLVYIGTDNCLYSNNTKVSVAGHNHDDRYYTQSQINAKFSELIGGADELYDTLKELEDWIKNNKDDVLGIITGKADKVHTHTKSDITDFAHKHTRDDITDFAHNHDDRYYTETEIDNNIYTKAQVNAELSKKLDKITYEYNKELALGSNGKVCIGKFPMYDTNITVDINSTTTTTYHGTLVIATQNINADGVGSYSATVYGDATNTLTPEIKIKYIPYNATTNPVGNRLFEIYVNLPGWSKNLIHVRAVALSGTPTNIVENVATIPSDATIVPVNALRNTYALKSDYDSHNHDNRYYTETESDDRFAPKSHGTHVTGTAFTSGNNGNGEHNCNNIASNGHWYYTSNGPAKTLGATTDDGALYSQAYSASWVAQIAQDYRDGDLFTRGKNNGTWTNWKAVSYDGHTHTRDSITDFAHGHDLFDETKDGFCPAATSTTKFLRGDGTWQTPSNTVPSGYCTTAAATNAKAASFTYYAATANRYFQINFRYANTAAKALTLNINSTGAKPIYINGTASSSSNYTLPAGPYIAYYDGAKYLINTDGTIPRVSHTGHSHAWGEITGKPETFTPASHKHDDRYYTKTEVNNLGLVKITVPLTVDSDAWMDTGIEGNQLSTGTHIVQMYVNGSGQGGQWQEYYSGIMSWFAGNCNGADNDEIFLHKAGHATNGHSMFLRTQRQTGSKPLKLQIRASSKFTADVNIQFKFKKMI